MITDTKVLLLCFWRTFRDAFYLLNKSANCIAFLGVNVLPWENLWAWISSQNFLNWGCVGEKWVPQINNMSNRNSLDVTFFSSFCFHLFLPSKLKKEFVPYGCYGLKLINEHITLITFLPSFFALPPCLSPSFFIFSSSLFPSKPYTSITHSFSHLLNKYLRRAHSMPDTLWSSGDIMVTQNRGMPALIKL